MVVGMMDETDGSQADETVHFGLDGAEFELNLSNAHAEELRHVLEPYIKAGRKTGGMRNGRANTNKEAGLGLRGPSNSVSRYRIVAESASSYRVESPRQR